MTLLCQNNIGFVASGVAVPNYDRSGTEIGVVHFGPGAFHRAHQAYYFDKLLATNPNYAIAEISLNSPHVRDILNNQDNLYTLVQVNNSSAFQIIGAIKEVLFAPDARPRIIELLAAASTKFVTATITEKGYYLDANGKLDFVASEINDELAKPTEFRTIYGALIAGLRTRKNAGIPPFAVLICDNLSNNGAVFKEALVDHALRTAPELLEYVQSIACPCTMVDSITPATTDALRLKVEAAIHLKDNWPIAREPFSQWVIEEFDGHTQIDWSTLGVSITNDIGQYERAKLRILNGAHSALAYFGILRGHEFVHQAMQDLEIKSHINLMINAEILPLLSADFSLNDYASAVMQRFENPEIRHSLSQIAWDGSKKLPFRILASIEEALDANRSIARLTLSIACWFAFIIKKAAANDEIIDPLSVQLTAIGLEASSCLGRPEPLVNLFTRSIPAFTKLRENQQFMDVLISAFSQISSQIGVQNEKPLIA